MSEKSARSFEAYFRETIVPALEPIEAERSRWRQRARVVGFLVAAAAVAGFMFLPVNLSARLPPRMPRWSWPALAGAVPLLLTAGGFSMWARRKLRPLYKERAVAAVAQFIDPTLSFLADGGITEERFCASGIFTESVYRYSTEDLVSGTVGQTGVEFAEVDAEEQVEDSDGKKSERTIFRGLLFIADFNKDFRGRTVVLPDLAEQLLGHFGQTLQGLTGAGRGELVKLEDPEFERSFVVYSDDQVEARYILSPSLMRRILDVATKVGTRVYLSFRGSQLFLAIPLDRDLFEPPSSGSWLDQGAAEQHLRDMQLVLGFVDDLNLNTRIWTKA